MINQNATGNYLPILQILKDSMDNNFTQEELAITFDCSVKTIRNFLKGETINFEYLYKLSCILDLEIEIDFKK